jgi:hypothetical protein
MGKSDPSNKPYEGKSRQDLEIYYEKIEPKLMIYSEPPRDYSKDMKILKEQLKEELRKEFSFFVDAYKSKKQD